METGRESEWLKILRVAELLLAGDRSAAELMAARGLSRATLMRYLSELRHIGCDIVSMREGGDRARYSLRNGQAVAGRLRAWIGLEESRDLRDPARF